MSYYVRPMGDYKTYGYAGDPGFLSSLWKGVKKIGGAALKIAFPGPVSIYESIATPPIRQVPMKPQQFLPGGMPTSFPGVGAAPGSLAAISGRGTMRFPSATAGQVAGLPRGARPFGADGLCPCGFHPEKSGAGYCVRNRRMNVANPRALRRGMRRVSGFEKLARRTISFTRRVKIKKKSAT